MTEPVPLLILAAVVLSTIGATIVPWYVRIGLRKVLSRDDGPGVGGGSGDRAPRSRKKVPVSVIVTARNEQEEIGRCLDALTRQDYDHENYEIIVVNDRSTDGTPEIIERYRGGFHDVRRIDVRDVPDGIAPKKYALARGIAAARHELLLFTDADCEPLPGWIDAMVRCFAPDVGIAIGFSPDRPERGLAARLNRFETYRTAALMIGFAARGHPYMAVGRNWAYRREAFIAAGGFESIRAYQGGDDDLLLQEMLKEGKWKAAVCTGRNAFVPTRPTRRFRDLVRRKIRHFTAGAGYRTAALAVLAGSHLMQWASVFSCVAAGFVIHPLLFMPILVPLTLQYQNILTMQRDVERPSVADHVTSFLMEPAYLLFYSPLGISGLFMRPTWR